MDLIDMPGLDSIVDEHRGPSLLASASPAAWMLLHSALMSAVCVSGLYLVGRDDRFEVAAAFNLAADRASDFGPLVALLEMDDVLFVEDVDALHADAPEVFAFIPECARFRFIAATIIEQARGDMGILIVADTRVRRKLSPAQSYVFRMHAIQLSKVSEPEERRIGATGEDASSVRLRLLESVVVTANDAILVTEAEPIDLPGPRIVYCNRAFERTTGYREADVLGKTPRILQAPGVDREALDRLKAALRAWQPIEVELLNVRKDGTLFWVELSIVPVANEKGWFTHWVSVQRDVSDRKTAEEVAVRVRVAEAENRAFEAEIAERKRMEVQLSYEASHDHLTKLHNRAHFMRCLSEVLNDRRNRSGKAVLFLDLDGFKLVNDSLGHRAGDFLLVTSADRLRACLRPQDMVARIGGDEFAIILPDGGIDAATAIASRINERLARPVMFGELKLFTSCSIGIAVTGDRRIVPDVMLRNADIAMYEAKKRSSGGYAIYTDRMHSDVSDALALQTDLRLAISRNELSLHYQTICDPTDKSIRGIEALVRWNHPIRGTVAPLTFIPLAEEIGFIADIGRWVTSQACRQFAAWSRIYLTDGLRISVNVSGDELLRTDFISDLAQILSETGLLPSQLQLEITESVFLRHPDPIGEVLSAVRRTGVTVALDDFGTGFSSLAYIDQYQIDCIKIDRSFVMRMATRERTLAIVKTIIELGRVLNLQIVAEGVETEAQCDLLAQLGCTAIQGFLFARPVPPERLAERLGAIGLS